MDQDKIDLSSVNKTKKQLTFPKLSNPFKKQSGIKRDSEGKFASGSGGLKIGKKFNLKRSLPVIVVVALVGGFFVFRSFAATTLYSYQYSVAKCSEGAWAQSVETKEACQNKSAEGLTFRMYKGLLARNPDEGGYKFWTQKLAGDRVRPTDMANKFVGESKTLQAKSNAQFVDDLYKNFLKRSPDSAGRTSWINRLNSKEWTKGRVATHFAITTEAISKHSADLTTYLKTAPKVAIVETAKKAQDERLLKSTQAANSAKAKYNSIKDLPSGSRKYRDAAASIAAKGTPSRADLTAIANNDKAIRANLAKAQTAIKGIMANEKTNKGFYDRAATAAAYSPDIPATNVKKQYDLTVTYRKNGQAAEAGLNKLLADIAGGYKTAEGRYQAEQARIAAEAARRAAEAAANQGGGGGGGGGGGTVPSSLNPRACSIPVKQITRSSGRHCIARLQQVGGGTVDGIWGPQTEFISAYVRRAPPTGSACSDPNSQACRDALARELGNGGFNIGGGALPSFSQLPKFYPPYPKCGSGWDVFKKGVRCVRPPVGTTKKSFSEGVKIYITSYTHCKRYVAIGVVKDNDCKTVSGKWRPSAQPPFIY